MDPLYAAIATYALSSAATIAEVIRAGVNSVDAGQAEAAYSIGLSSRQTFLRIILPQALYQALPNFGNLVIGYLKDTSLAFSIGVMDMSGRGQTLITLSNHALEVYISLSIIYYLTAVLLEYSFKWIEKRVKKKTPDSRVFSISSYKGEIMMPLDVPFIGTAVMAMLKTIPLTLAMTFFPILFGFIIAIGLTLIRMYHVRFLEPIAKFYVSFSKHPSNFAYYADLLRHSPIGGFLSKSFGLGISANKIPVVVFVIIALSFTAGAYLTEILRSGIIAVDIGQMEAAYSVGYTHGQAIRKVLLPQAFMIALPNFTNLCIGFLHTTSIAAIVAVPEITGMATIVASDNYAFLEAFIGAALIYWFLTILIEAINYILEKNIAKYRGGTV